VLASHFGRTPRYNVRAPPAMVLAAFAALAQAKVDIAAIEKEIELP
jgi:hypothetical protein